MKPVELFTRLIISNSSRSIFLRNFIWMSVGIGLDFSIKAIYFILLARILGSKEYGIFAGIVAIVYFLSPFVTWGSEVILVKNVSRDKTLFPIYWGGALTVTLFMSIILTGLAFLVCIIIFGYSVNFMIPICLAIGEYFGLRLSNLAGRAFQSFEKLKYTSLIATSVSVFRLLSVLSIMFFSLPKTAETWSLLYMLSSILAGIIGLLAVKIYLGTGKLGFGPLSRMKLEGFYYAIDSSSSGVYNDFDKSLLLRYSGEAIAGVYAASYRLIDIFTVPIRAIIASSLPNFFQRGKFGINETLAYAKRLLPVSLIFSFLGALCLLFLRYVMPYFLGLNFSELTKIIPWLLPVLIFRSFHFLAANALTGADMQLHRTICQVFSAILNIFLNILLIPKYSWLGAAWTSIITDGLLAILMWGWLIGQSKK